MYENNGCEKIESFTKRRISYIEKQILSLVNMKVCTCRAPDLIEEVSSGDDAIA